MGISDRIAGGTDGIAQLEDMALMDMEGYNTAVTKVRSARRRKTKRAPTAR